jgi:Ca-activated chloride channel family protein
LLSASWLLAQTTPSFRAGVSLFHLDTEVVDESGRSITGLNKGDFRIFDDGQGQPIAMFSASEQPLDLILLVDISRSMRSKVEEIAAASGAALKELRPDDRVSVLVFNTKTRVISPLTSDAAQTKQALNNVLNLPFRGGTAIRRAVSEAAERFTRFDDRQEQCRRAVLVLTDNVGILGRSEGSVVNTLREADALLSGLIVSNRLANISALGLLFPFGVKRPGGIEGIVEKTGGDVIYSDDLTTAFPEMIHRLRSRYSLYYRIPGNQVGRERMLRVELSTEAMTRFPGTHVRAPKTYRVR